MQKIKENMVLEITVYQICIGMTFLWSQKLKFNPYNEVSQCFDSLNQSTERLHCKS